MVVFFYLCCILKGARSVVYIIITGKHQVAKHVYSTIQSRPVIDVLRLLGLHIVCTAYRSESPLLFGSGNNHADKFCTYLGNLLEKNKVALNSLGVSSEHIGMYYCSFGCVGI